jgi:hypothetical protein
VRLANKESGLRTKSDASLLLDFLSFLPPGRFFALSVQFGTVRVDESRFFVDIWKNIVYN